MYSGMGDALKELWFGLIASLVIFMPLGVWKAYELMSEFVSHISWN